MKILLVTIFHIFLIFIFLTNPKQILAISKIGKFQIYELCFESSYLPENPYDTYLLKLQITDPKGNKFLIDGFFDGDGKGGEKGKIWKVRLCPYEEGLWTWRTVPGDKVDKKLNGIEGNFFCLESGDIGGVVAEKKFFKFQDGGYTYLQGNFLDFSNGLRTTHTYMSETTTDIQREFILKRHRNFSNVNKVNIYLANKGDYEGQSVTPWLGTASNNDKSKMDLSRWKDYDIYIQRFKENKLLAEIWFFADDSGFGKLSQKIKNRLFRYAMARTSAYSNVLYVIALEWAEGWSKSDVSISGEYIQQHNPWKRLLSVHNITPRTWKNFLSLQNMTPRKVIKNIPWPVAQNKHWAFSGENWATFIASQPGNSANSKEVNQLAIKMRKDENIPHLSEEFGVLTKDSDRRLRANMWANLCGGAAGGGTGSDLKAFMNFLEESKIPFHRMIPKNELVQGGGTKRFCLAKDGHHYLVYSLMGRFDLNIQGKNLKGFWFNPRNPNSRLSNYFLIQSRQNSFLPPKDISKDWVLWVTDQSNLRPNSIYPSKIPALTKVSVNKDQN